MNTNSNNVNMAAMLAFVNNPAVVQGIKDLEAARVEAKETRALVDAYIRPVFARFDFRDVRTGEKIEDERQLYRADLKSQQMRDYEAACDAEHRRQGYDLPPGYCPALVAENRINEIEKRLLDLASTAFRVDFRRTYGEMRAKVLCWIEDSARLPR